MRKGAKRKTRQDDGEQQPKKNQPPRAKRAKPEPEPEYFEDKRNLVNPILQNFNLFAIQLETCNSIVYVLPYFFPPILGNDNPVVASLSFVY